MHKLDCYMFDAWGGLQSGSGYALGCGLTIDQKYLLKNHRYKYLTGGCNCSFRHLWLSDTLSWMIYSKAGGLWFILCYLCYSQVCYTGHINAHSGRSVLLCRLPVQSQWYLVDMIEVLVCCDDSKPMCEHQWGLASYLTLHSSTFIMIYLYTWTR